VPTNPPQPGTATIIDHRHVDASRLSAQERQRAANAITYFNHRSVGRNILDQIDYWGSINVRPGTGTGQGINHTEEGNNASHLSKLRAFESNVRAGHEIAFQKFCYVDFPIRDSGQTVFNNYRAYMERLQARYPNTVFVWWTAPVRSSDDNPRRKEFNRLVRQHVRANGGILFDVAAIESDGGRCGTDVMCAAYTSDGGHLNTTGARRVAGAFWAMLAAAANTPPG
jgi:hypothetical protein